MRGVEDMIAPPEEIMEGAVEIVLTEGHPVQFIAGVDQVLIMGVLVLVALSTIGITVRHTTGTGVLYMGGTEGRYCTESFLIFINNSFRLMLCDNSK